MPTNIKALYKVSREDIHFFIDRREMPGVQSVNVDYPTLAENMRYLGMNRLVTAPLVEPNSSISINSLMISKDWFQQMTGDYGVNGYILRSRTDTSKNISFTSGYLTSYQVTYSIGEIPRIDTTFQIFGDIGTMAEPNPDVGYNWNNIANSVSNDSLLIPAPGSMSVNFNEIDTNRLLSYTLKIDVPRSPVFICGQREPWKVETVGPKAINCSFRLEIVDLEMRRMLDFPKINDVESLTVNINSNEYFTPANTYRFSNLKLISQGLEANVDGNLIATLNYSTLQV